MFILGRSWAAGESTSLVFFSVLRKGARNLEKTFQESFWDMNERVCTPTGAKPLDDGESHRHAQVFHLEVISQRPARALALGAEQERPSHQWTLELCPFRWSCPFRFQLLSYPIHSVPLSVTEGCLFRPRARHQPTGAGTS